MSKYFAKEKLHRSSIGRASDCYSGDYWFDPSRCSHMEVIRPDEDLVLKTSARKGCRCESMPLPPSARIAQSAEQTVDNRSVESSNLSSCTILEGGVTGNSERSERSVPGSNPGLP